MGPPLPAASLGTTAAAPAWLLLLMIAATVIGSATAEEDWGYEGDQGPSHWPGICQIGTHQSPIDLSSKTVGFKRGKFENLFPLNYDKSYNASITNNGHTVQLQITEPHSVMVVGGGLNHAFVLEQVHFHWGAEHTFGSDRPPLEAHFVHYDKAKGSFDNAKNKEKGLAVLGVLFKEDSEDNPKLEFLKTIDGMKVKALENLTWTPQNLLPADVTRFYRYYGSLTTPGCGEVVLWTMLHDRVPISRKQLKYFAHLHGPDGKVLSSNYRPIQHLNDRIVYFQDEPAPAVQYFSNSARIAMNPGFVLLIPVIFVTVFTT